MDLKNYVRYIKDFPIEGILFRDLIPIWEDKETFHLSIKSLKKEVEDLNVNHIVCLEARGFLVGAPLAYEMGLGFSIIRKPGRIPGDTLKSDYSNEYTTGTEVEIHKESLENKKNILVVDDILATGKSSISCVDLIKQFNGVTLVGFAYLLEIQELKGRKLLESLAPVKALIID